MPIFPRQGTPCMSWHEMLPHDRCTLNIEDSCAHQLVLLLFYLPPVRGVSGESGGIEPLDYILYRQWSPAQKSQPLRL